MDEGTASKIGFLDKNFSVLLHNFLGAAKRLLWIAVLLSLLVGGIVFYREDRSYRPHYSSSAVFSVTANYAGTTDILSYSTYLNIATASNLAATFPYVISSDTTRELLRQELHVDTINAAIYATATAESALFTMTSRSLSAQDAYDVLLATVAVYPHAASSIIGDTQIQIIDLPAGPSTEPVNSNPALKNALTAALITLLLGLVCIFLLSMTRKTVHSSEDLRRLVNLKCLAYVPFIRQKRRSKQMSFPLIITSSRVSSGFSESIRALRIKLLKQTEPSDARVIMVTSTLPNEGKSTIAINLALSLAAEGKRVLLVDGDLRKQSLKAALGLDAPSDGLVEMLSGNTQNFRLLTVPKSTLLLLSGDKTDDRPQLLLDSEKMRRFIELLRTKLDYIIIDSPPAGILSDAATIAKYADATLYVVRQDLANSGQIQDTIQSLFDSGANLIGCVLNCTQLNTTRSGYGRKYDSYAYGYKYPDVGSYGETCGSEETPSR